MEKIEKLRRVDIKSADNQEREFKNIEIKGIRIKNASNRWGMK